MQLEVQPQALTGQAPLIGRLGGQLAELAGEVRGLAGVAGATGSPEAAAAAERFAQIWSQTVLLMADTVGALGAATDQAAAAYTTVDASVMPQAGER
jgi:phage-related tail protein